MPASEQTYRGPTASICVRTTPPRLLGAHFDKSFVNLELVFDSDVVPREGDDDDNACIRILIYIYYYIFIYIYYIIYNINHILCNRGICLCKEGMINVMMRCKMLIG